MTSRFCIFLIISMCFMSIAQAQDKDDDSPEPKLISAPSPIYPPEAKDAGIGGRITVRVVVDALGAVLDVDSPTGPAQICDSGLNDPRLVALRESVVEALKNAKFEPAMKNGRPVKSVVYISSTFDPGKEKPGAADRKMVNGGVVNGKALSLPKPDYPARARSDRVSGAVSIKIVIDETGKVFTAEPVSGHPLLRQASVDAACRAKFSPTSLGGEPVRVTGVVTYNFIP
jgi:TonB family protein